MSCCRASLGGPWRSRHSRASPGGGALLCPVAVSQSDAWLTHPPLDQTFTQREIGVRARGGGLEPSSTSYMAVNRTPSTPPSSTLPAQPPSPGAVSPVGIRGVVAMRRYRRRGASVSAAGEPGEPKISSREPRRPTMPELRCGHGARVRGLSSAVWMVGGVVLQCMRGSLDRVARPYWQRVGVMVMMGG